MGIQIPPVLVLIVCKTVLAGPPDQNTAYTKWENLDWATEHSMMVCRRNEIQLYDPVEGMKLKATDDPAPPLNPNFADAGQCARAGIRLGHGLGPGPQKHALARVACRLPGPDRGYADWSPHRL